MENTILIRGKEYPLMLSLAGTKALTKKFGGKNGIKGLGEKLEKAEYDEMLDILTWLICLLANASIALYNFENPDDKRPLLTEEFVQMAMEPADMIEQRDTIFGAVMAGANRDVKSMPSSPAGKNLDPQTVETLPQTEA